MKVRTGWLITLFFSCFIGLAVSASAATLEAGSGSGMRRNAVSIDIEGVWDSEDYVSIISFELTYDTSILIFDSWEEGPVLEDISRFVAVEDSTPAGTIYFVVVEMNEPVEGVFESGTLFTVKFEIDEDAALGDTDLTLSDVGFIDKDSQVIAVSPAVTNGVITVNNVDFSGAPLSGLEPLDVEFTDLSTGVITSYDWDFGDGNTSTLQNPTNTYVGEGSYDVTLTVSGPGGSGEEIKAGYITVLDSTPPAAVDDLVVSSLSDSAVTLYWHAPGDNGTSGTAAEYDLRYATDFIVESGAGADEVNWADALSAAGEPTPQEAGTVQSAEVTGLADGTTYYFALKTADENANISGLSNVVSATTYTSAVINEVTASPGSGSAPLEVSFTVDAEDVDGYVVKYEWDFDGKGVYDWQAKDTGDTSYIYHYPGTYPATVRVTDDQGFISTYTVMIEVSAEAQSPEVVLSVAPEEEGIAPLKVIFSAQVVTSSSDIVKYEWDFDGDGCIDSRSHYTGTVVRRYSEPGLYEAAVYVMDAAGRIGGDSIYILVEENELFNPDVVINTQDLAVSEGLREVEFSAVIISGLGVGSVRYEWDFNGDGVYDIVSRENISRTYTYREPGAYRVRLRLTNSRNIAKVVEKTVHVEDDIEADYPAADFGVPAEECNVYSWLDFPDQSEATGGYGIVSYQWDFDGDRVWDLQTETAALTVTEMYYLPGYYPVRLKVVNAQGVSDETVRFISVGGSVAEYVAIIEPLDNSILAGDAVSILARSNIARGSVGEVEFMYKNLAGEDDWTVIGAGQEINQTHYGISWDTGAREEGEYQLRALYTDISGQEFYSPPITVEIDRESEDVDVEEGVTLESGGQHIKRAAVYLNIENEVYLHDGTTGVIPQGVLESDEDKLEIIIVAPAGIGVAPLARAAGQYRDCQMVSGQEEFSQAVTLIIPYLDANGDGLVDGTSSEESSLNAYWYNPSAAGWEEVTQVTVYADENYVELETEHFSFFGLGWEDLTGGGDDDSGGGDDDDDSLCFIVTASAGRDSREVKVLSEFRDKYLLTNRPGRKLVDFYYRISPPIAGYIEDKPAVKKAVRTMLAPVVWAADKLNQKR